MQKLTNETRTDGGSVTRVLPEWQPIETAPKDGTEVLLFSSHRFGTKTPALCKWWTAEQCAENDGGDPEDYKADWYTIEDEYDCFCRPTHWMPLPVPPSQEG